MRLKNSSAFTIVEIVIVIAIVAILSSLAIATFTSVRQDSRDAARQGNATIITEALEKYYEKNGEYPSVASITNSNPANTAAVVAQRLSVPVESLVMPNMPSTTTNGLAGGSEPANGFLVYEAYSAEDNNSCQTSLTGGCDSFTLRYEEESSGETVAIESRRSTRPATAAPELAVSGINSTSISASWSEVDGVVSYTLQRSLTEDMASPTITSHTATSTTVGSLAPDTEYFFRVRANMPSGATEWSGVQSATTSGVPAPTGTITITAAMSGTNARGTAGGGTCPSGATIERQIRYQQNSDAWQGWVTTTSYRDIPATEGYRYTFQSQARCKVGSVGGPWALSGTANVVRPVTAPSGLTISAAMSGTNARGTAGGGACATGTSMERQIRYHSTNTSTDGTWSSYVTGTPRDVPATQGYKYTFQQQARCVGTNASSGYTASSTASVSRPISTSPTTPTLSVSTNTTNGTVTWTFNMTCPSGTNKEYLLRRTSSEASYDSGWSTTPTTTGSYTWANSEGYSLSMQIQGRCATPYSATGYLTSAVSSAVAPIRTPAAPTNFVYFLRQDRYWDQWTWSNPTCGAGTRPEHYENSYLAGAGWYWVETGQEGWRYGTGWSPTRQYEASPIYGTYNNPAYPSNSSNIKVQHKAFYYCLNTVTRRVSAAGPVGYSAYTTVPSW